MMDADAVLAQGLALFQQEQRVVYSPLSFVFLPDLPYSP